MQSSPDHTSKYTLVGKGPAITGLQILLLDCLSNGGVVAGPLRVMWGKYQQQPKGRTT